MKPENKQMKAFLASHGIICTPKRIDSGSLRGTWRLYDGKQSWTAELAEKLNSLGFTGIEGKPLDMLCGNGGLFSVFVRQRVCPPLG